MHILCLGSRLVCFAAKGAKTKHPAKNFFQCMSGMSFCPAFSHGLRSLWHLFFGTIALMEFVLKNPCQQLCSFSHAPCQQSYACPMARGLETLVGLGRAVFRNNRIDLKFAQKNSCQQLCIFSVAPCQRSYACPIAQRLQST